MKKAVMMYSLGKDSTLAYEVAKKEYNIDRIIVMFDDEREISQVHMVNKAIVNEVARRMGVEVDFRPSRKDFNQAWKELYIEYANKGYQYMIHGDLYLTDVKKFKDDHAKGSGCENVYPLWNLGVTETSKLILDSGIDSYVVVVNRDDLIPFLGKKYSEIVDKIPSDCCICAENGEFHTLVCKSPTIGKIDYIFDEVKQLDNIFDEKTFRYWYVLAKGIK